MQQFLKVYGMSATKNNDITAFKAKEAPAEKCPNISDDCPEAFQWSWLDLSFEIVFAVCFSVISWAHLKKKTSNWGVGYFGKVACWGDSWPGLQESWQCSHAVRAWVFVFQDWHRQVQTTSLIWQRGMWENVLSEAACSCVHKRLCYAGSCDTTSRSNPDTWELLQIGDCKLPVPFSP